MKVSRKQAGLKIELSNCQLELINLLSIGLEE